MTLIDISRPLRTGGPHWPGDTPTEFRLGVRIAEGAPCNVGRLTLSVHNGTHADAPFHYHDPGATIDRVPLDAFVGPARVIDARGHATLGRGLFEEFEAATLAATPRILFRTDAWPEPSPFPAMWPLMDLALPAYLAERGVQLIGFDVPSVDELTSKELPRHHRARAAGLLILENLDLSAAAPGVYELLALPLRIEGADASPLRAVLRTSSS